eukprot:scaffold75329_cov36-Phaeocystis_antarctica.AAC.1
MCTFEGCCSLTDLTLPATLTTIRNRAFEGCCSLTKLTLPAALTTIGERVFLECHSLTEVNLPASIVQIGYGAFAGCSSLTARGALNSRARAIRWGPAGLMGNTMLAPPSSARDNPDGSQQEPVELNLPQLPI